MIVEKGRIFTERERRHAAPNQKNSTSEFELTQFQDVACPGVYLFRFEACEAARAELFHGEAAHDRAVDHSASQSGVILLADPSEIAHKAAGESVARACGIVRLLKWECRNAKDAIFVHEHGAVFAAFYDESGGAHFEDVFCGAEKVVFIRKLAGFGIVDDEDVHVFEGFL